MGAVREQVRDIYRSCVSVVVYISGLCPGPTYRSQSVGQDYQDEQNQRIHRHPEVVAKVETPLPRFRTVVWRDKKPASASSLDVHLNTLYRLGYENLNCTVSSPGFELCMLANFISSSLVSAASV